MSIFSFIVDKIDISNVKVTYSKALLSTIFMLKASYSTGIYTSCPFVEKFGEYLFHHAKVSKIEER